jgi:cell division protein FtsA
MLAQTNKTLNVLDIGTSKVTSVIARFVDNKFEILGVGNHSSGGIRHGVISDVKMARSAIASAVYEAEKMAGRNADKVIINVSNPLIKSRTITIRTDFGGNQILPSDLRKLRNIVFSKIDITKDEILSYKVLKHDLDEMKGISDPEFMFANLLVSYVHIVTVPVKYLINMGSCLLGCQLKIGNFILSSEASASVCLDDSEKVEGCVLIDIGGGNADYIVYKNKKVLECGVIPLGGINITRDIAECFSISFAEAEKIKVLHGGLERLGVVEGNIIEIKGTNKIVNTHVLNKVIRARFLEVMNFVMKRLREKKQYRTCLNKIVFTGGGSKLSGLVEFIDQKYKASARVGAPNNIKIEGGFSEDPVFSTSLGLIKSSVVKRDYGFRHESSKIKKAIEWLKQNF